MPSCPASGFSQAYGWLLQEAKTNDLIKEPGSSEILPGQKQCLQHSGFWHAFLRRDLLNGGTIIENALLPILPDSTRWTDGSPFLGTLCEEVLCKMCGAKVLKCFLEANTHKQHTEYVGGNSEPVLLLVSGVISGPLASESNLS